MNLKTLKFDYSIVVHQKKIPTVFWAPIKFYFLDHYQYWNNALNIKYEEEKNKYKRQNEPLKFVLGVFCERIAKLRSD